MATKTSIIGELGEAALLLPQHLQQALAANDRLKYCFTLLQAAENHANHPEEPPLDLKAERIAANLPAGELDTAVVESRREAGCGSGCWRTSHRCPHRWRSADPAKPRPSAHAPELCWPRCRSSPTTGYPPGWSAQ